MDGHRGDPGFTLLELVVVLALLTVILGLGMPAFNRVIDRSVTTVEARRLAVAINLARSEAIERNLPVTLCAAAGSRNSRQCNGFYDGGWMVFADVSGNRIFDAQTDEIVRTYASLRDGYVITNRSGTRLANEKITFYPDGTAGRTVTFQVCSEQGSASEGVSIVLNNIGRLRMARDWGTCPEG